MKLNNTQKFVSESLNEFASSKRSFSDIEDDEPTVNSRDDEWYGSPEDEEPEIEDIIPNNELDYDDDEVKEVIKTKIDKIEDYNTSKSLLKHLKTIIDINKGKPDKDKNYITFKVLGKPGDIVDGIPFDIKGTKDDTTVTFIRKGTKNVKLVKLKDILLESKQTLHNNINENDLNDFNYTFNMYLRNVCVELLNYPDFLFDRFDIDYSIHPSELKQYIEDDLECYETIENGYETHVSVDDIVNEITNL